MGAPRNALTVPSSNQDVLREQFAQTFEENPIMAVKRWSELREDQKTGPMLPAETARQKLKDAGLENDLKVSDAGITQAALDTLMFRKRIEKKRQEIFARSEGGLAQGAARLGVAFATTLADPISAGLNFLPVVGQVRYARWLASAGSVAGRIGVRAGAGAIEGVAGAALYEPFIYTMRTQEQADYDSTDSLLNVAFGGVVGSGLHVTVGSIGELYSGLRPAREAAPRIEPAVSPRPVELLPENIQRAIFDQPRAADIVNAMSPEAQQAALRAAVGQAVEGRAINVEPVVQAAPIKQTELPEFRQWFGDSKAVDESGAPLRVYHGTNTDFDAFESGRNKAQNETGIFFSTDGSIASRYAGYDETFPAKSIGSVLPAYLRIDKLKTVDFRGSKLGRPEAIAQARAEGFDGLLIKNHYDAGGVQDQYVVFSPSQVKSAIGNSGRFDPQSASLTDPIDPEYRVATEQAEVTLAREVENTTEANLKAAEEEADLAVAEAKELGDRLGVKMDDDADIAAINEAADKAERWARVAELATVCLVRGD